MNIESLTQIVGSDRIATDQDSLQTYGKDWTKHYQPNASAIVFPKTADDVVKIVQWARQNKVALVPSGGRTGLSAGAYALKGEVVVSFEKMNRILEFNPYDQTVTCEAGVVTEDLQNFAKDKSLYFPVDFASRGSSQIGGNAATNAGGIKVIRYGLIRNWITSLQVVTGTGDLMNLNNSLVKNATGYDLRHLFIGSEGTLGFITGVTVSLARPPIEPTLFLMAVPSLASIMKVYAAFRSQFSILAYEMFTDLAMSYVLAMGRVSDPLSSPSPYYVLVEIENESEAVMEKAGLLFEKLMEEGHVTDGTMSQNNKQYVDFWSLREDITEATSHKLPYKNDISVRVAKVPEFLEQMNSILEKDYPDFEVVWFGHIGDGNLHVNILKPDTMTSEEFTRRCHQVDNDMFSMIKNLGGSVSAEHGVGLVKKPFLNFTRSESEIGYMRQIKKIFDPDGILNPGKIFD